MKKYMYLLLLIGVLALVVWSVSSYLVERSVKTLTYTVVEKREGYEIRQYEPYIAAQVEVAGTHEEALNEGFRILAEYIFGGNTRQTSIAMTAPVTEGVAEKIAMTAPVLEAASDTGRIVSFVMPEEYTLETLPKPNNPRVTLVPQESRRVAALTFSWFRNDTRVQKKQVELQALLARDGVVSTGRPEYAGYNAPFTAPWMNRNEILIEIK